jgi:hypothetical protein
MANFIWLGMILIFVFTKRSTNMAKQKNSGLNMGNVTQDAGKLKFPIGKDGKVSILGKRAPPGMDKDISKYVKK